MLHTLCSVSRTWIGWFSSSTCSWRESSKISGAWFYRPCHVQSMVSVVNALVPDNTEAVVPHFYSFSPPKFMQFTISASSYLCTNQPVIHQRWCPTGGLWGVMRPWFQHYIYCLLVYIVCFSTYLFSSLFPVVAEQRMMPGCWLMVESVLLSCPQCFETVG